MTKHPVEMNLFWGRTDFAQNVFQQKLPYISILRRLHNPWICNHEVGCKIPSLGQHENLLTMH